MGGKQALDFTPDEQASQPPYPLGPETLFVAYPTLFIEGRILITRE